MTTLLGVRTAVVAGVIALAASPLSAERLPVRTFTTADGLPRDQLQCVRSDRRGFVWFCTAEGLVRFDGQAAVTFGRDHGLSPPGVRSFLNASGDRYFVGADAGLFAFDASVVASPVRFRAIKRDGGQRSPGVNTLAESRDGSIWCGTGNGLFHLSQAHGRTHLVEVEIGLPREIENDRIVRALLEDERGILWVGAGSGLYAREPEGRVTHLTVAEGPRANEVLALALDAQGRLLAATREGLVVLDREAILRRDRHVVRRVLTERDGLPDRNVRSFHIEGHTLWIGTIFGLAEASLTTAGDLKVDRTLLGFPAWGIATDLRGNVWMATDAGARRWSRQGFITYSTDDGLPGARVASLFETSRGEVCATTMGANRRDHSCFDGQRFRPIRSAAIERIRDTGGGLSQMTLQDRRGGWWIPTSEGLLRFAPGPVSSLTTARPASTYTRRHGLRSDSIFRLFEDSRGGIWVATYAEGANGLARIDPVTEAVRVFGPADGLQHDGTPMHALAEDRFGALWIGFGDGRLLRYRNRFEEIPLRPLQPGQEPASYELVGSIVADRQGRVWIASTTHGLGRLDDPRAAVPAIRWYGKADGLSSDTAWTIVEDLSGGLFVGTGRGVDRFDPATDRFTHYAAADGVPRGEVSGALRDRSGRIWLATTDGVARFDARTEALHPQPVRLITAIRVGGMSLPARADGTQRVDRFTVQPGDRRLEIDFVSPGARTADGLRYQHQLEGVDRDWTTTDARTVALAGATPGSYRFLVRAVFADGTASDPAVAEFTVLAPFWQRRWVVTLAAVCTCALAFVVHRSRVRHAIAVERVRSQIAADLHDGVGASLSRIAILSEVVRQQAHSALPDAMPALTAISDNARAVIDDMSDAVWFIDPQVDNIQQVVIRTRAMASELFDGQRIRWSVEATDSASGVSLASEQRRHVYLIIKEALTNVLRHAQATNVVVHITASRGRLRLEVTDDGIGLDGKARHGSPGPGGGHGLENMRRRASALGGTGRIVSPPGAAAPASSWRYRWHNRMFMRLATSDRDANMSPVNGARGEASSPAPLRVAIVEDDVTTREGLAALIDGTQGYRCVGRYGSVEELLRRPPDRPSDVVLLDINLPGISGAEGVRRVRERWSSTEVLMLTVYSDENKIFESICNGAVGYLLKKTPPARLIDAIREAASGGAPMSPEIARKVVTLFRKTPVAERPSEALTPQELRLLQLLADGHSYQAAAERLAISVNTVRSYVRNVYDKLHVHSKSEAVSKALRSGLIV